MKVKLGKLNEMKKREFIKKIGASAVAVGNVGIWNMGCSSKNNNQEETNMAESQQKLKNWAWIKPPAKWSLDDWKQKLAIAKKSGFDALVLNVYDGHVSYFENQRLPVKEVLAEKIIPICKALEMEFHAWMFTMPCNNPEIVANHQDWYAVNGLGQSAATHPAYVDYYKFLCPHHPEAQEFIQQNAISLAEIDGVDGVHLDYVRLPDVILAKGLQPKYNIVQDKEYPEYDYCYSNYCIDLFKKETGIDPLKDLADPSANVAWRQFRYDSITNLVNNILVPAIKNRNKQVTAAVFPNWESVRQEWHKWDLDAFLPMLYHNFYDEDISFIKTHTNLALGRLAESDNIKPVYSGIFLPALNEDNSIEAACKMGIDGGGNGIALFSLELASDQQLAMLAKTLLV